MNNRTENAIRESRPETDCKAMIKRNLLTDAETAKVLNCSIQDLSQHQQLGEIEEIPFPDHRMYRIIRKHRAAGTFENHPPTQPDTAYPGPQSDQAEAFHPDRERAQAVGPRTEELVAAPESVAGVNVSLLLEQNKDRARLIREMRKNHALQSNLLRDIISRLRQHRLALIIALEVLLGAAIIFGTLARDRVVTARYDAYDMARMAAYKDRSVQQMQSDVDTLTTQSQQGAKQLRDSQLHSARLKAQLAIRDVKIKEAREMISRLIHEAQFSNPRYK